MERHLLTLIACIGSLFINGSVQVSCVKVSAQQIVPSLAEQMLNQLSDDQLRRLAQSITVKVLSGNTWGSGILIQKQGEVYTVLTNEHVLTPGSGKHYRIQTPDGHIYPAQLPKGISFKNDDLGLLQFRSANNSYTVTSLRALATPTVGDKVFAAGFPFTAKPSTSRGFVFTTGQISILLNKAFVGGYQIGYTSNIQKGMSGGPLLNHQGKVVGINGMHQYPLWGNPYVFKDGSLPSEAVQEQMSHFSWAIPIKTFLQLAPQFALTPINSQPTPPQSPPTPLRIMSATRSPILPLLRLDKS